MKTDSIEVQRAGLPIRRGPIRGLVIGGVLLIVAIALGTAFMVDSFRQRALENSARELESTVLMLARHFDQQFEDFEVVQNDILSYVHLAGIRTGDDYRRAMSGNDVHQLLKTKISAMSYVGGINLFDADGRLINTSEAWPTPAIDVADRDYFKAFKSGPQSPTVLVQPVHSRVTGAWTIVVARKLVGANGELLGVIGRGIEPSHFERFFASVALGDDAAISMLHRDGTLLARYPHLGEFIGQNFAAGPMFQQILAKTSAGGMHFNSLVDGQNRLGAVQELTNLPIMLVATRTTSAALADWREQTRLLIGAACLSALVIALMLFLIVRQLSRQHQAAQQRLSLEKQRLDTAINNMSQGLLLFDASHRVVVCNRRFIEMYDLSPGLIKPGCSFRDVVAHRQAAGSFAGDVDRYCAGIIRDMALGKTIIAQTSTGRSIQITNRPLADGGWIATHEDVTERQLSDQRIAHLAHYDALTDLPNRMLFRDKLEQELKRILRGEQLAVLYIDIDEFKSVNDSLGHPIGDQLLKSVAVRLSQCVRETDIVARLGGDEFAIVQTAIRRPSDVTDLVARIYQAIREPYACQGHELTADASIGIAMAPQDGTDLDQLVKNADLAMYGAKADGRRTYRFFEPEMDARVKARRTLELDLRQTIVDGGFELHYQPLVNLRSNSVVGCEALLRWRHPKRGMISPVEFIPVAEETGLINQLGEWVLTQACTEAATWPDHVKLAVNVSPVQFKSQTLALKVAAALATSGLPANRLELEITEAVLIRDDDTALTILHQLRAIGVRIALDDFGTGYSSLSYLQRFPFDKIKIDRCFITDVAEPDGSSSIVQAVVNIAAARNMTTTAEGVETEQQFDMLRTLGCTEMQGYLFSPAKPAAEIKQLLGGCHHQGAAVA
jgi:diguanylate cyclase (GGDEF)-like protein